MLRRTTPRRACRLRRLVAQQATQRRLNFALVVSRLRLTSRTRAFSGHARRYRCERNRRRWWRSSNVSRGRAGRETLAGGRRPPTSRRRVGNGRAPVVIRRRYDSRRGTPTVSPTVEWNITTAIRAIISHTSTKTPQSIAYVVQ